MKSRLLKFCYVPFTTAWSSKGIFAVLARQKNQVVHAINQPIFDMMSMQQVYFEQFIFPRYLWCVAICCCLNIVWVPLSARQEYRQLSNNPPIF
jgi:hypothetical protein